MAEETSTADAVKGTGDADAKSDTVLTTKGPQETVLVKPDVKAEGDSKADPKAETKVPEKYEDFKMPDGVEVDKAKLETFVPLAKELNLSQEQAQKLVDFYANSAQAMAKQAQDAYVAMRDSWRKSTETDPELGGQNFDTSIAMAKKGMAAFGKDGKIADPGLIEALNLTGAGNHPAVIRYFYKVGKAVSEGSFKVGDAVPAKKDLATLMYPSMASKE